MGGSAYAALHGWSPNKGSSVSVKSVYQVLQDLERFLLQCRVTSRSFNYEVTSRFETFGRLDAWQISYCDLRFTKSIGFGAGMFGFTVSGTLLGARLEHTLGIDSS